MFRMRQFLQIVDQLNKTQTDDKFLTGFGAPEGVARRDCVDKFLKIYPQYNKGLANEICDSAIAHEFIITETGIMPKDDRWLSVAPLKGRQLLSKSGYINQLADTVGKLPPVLTLFIALSALTVSILVAIFK